MQNACLAFEKHYEIKDLVGKLGSRETVRKLIKNEPGVVRVRNGEKMRKTRYFIPESVFQRIHNRLAA